VPESHKTGIKKQQSGIKKDSYGRADMGHM